MNFTLISGPCVIESEEMVLSIADKLVTFCDELNIKLIFKASYRKANRTSINSFTGIGDERAFAILARVRDIYKIKTTTDIHSVVEAGIVSKYVDILQIPAFLCRQTDILIAAAKTGKIVNIKKGQFATAEMMKDAIAKVEKYGGKAMITDRGNCFGYNDLIVDMRNIPLLQEIGVPVIVDITHTNMGNIDMTETLGRCAVAAGADGLFIETHPYPASTLSDSKNVYPLNKLYSLLEKLIKYAI